jgi:hypothetical protein
MRRALIGALVVSIANNALVTVSAKSLVHRDVRDIEINERWVSVLFPLPPSRELNDSLKSSKEELVG